MLPSLSSAPTTYCFTNDALKTAVDEWVTDRAATTVSYGHIKDWCKRKVTSMSDLFSGKSSLNDDISQWDVSEVTNMGGIFFGATSFNADISSWKVNKVTNMGSMFLGYIL